MKKITILMMLFFCFSIFSEELSIHDYLKNQTEENFLKVYQDLAQKIKENPKDFNSMISLATISQLSANKYSERVRTNLDSLGLREKFMFANFLLQQEKFEKSIEIYDKLNKKVPKWSCPWRHKGEAYYKMQNYELAEKALLKAIETKKDHFDAYVLLAQIQEKMNHFPEALKTLETGLNYQDKDDEGEVDNEELLTLYARLLKENNQIEKSKEIENKIKKN